MNLWVYKCRNDPDTAYNAWGDWANVFDKPWKPVPWGGAWATARPDGKRILNEEIEVGDLVLAWQSDRSAAIGVCKVTGRKRSRHGGTDLLLLAVEEFKTPVKLHDLKRATKPKLQQVTALKQGYSRTIYPTTTKEARLLLSACGSRLAERFGPPSKTSAKGRPK